jgi:D-alanyl-D-alanine dipeptidase
MAACGFHAYEREWWHYPLIDEPHPETYFDFEIEP